jgi:hypothetical protein
MVGAYGARVADPEAGCVEIEGELMWYDPVTVEVGRNKYTVYVAEGLLKGEKRTVRIVAGGVGPEKGAWVVAPVPKGTTVEGSDADVCLVKGKDSRTVVLNSGFMHVSIQDDVAYRGPRIKTFYKLIFRMQSMSIGASATEFVALAARDGKNTLVRQAGFRPYQGDTDCEKQNDTDASGHEIHVKSYSTKAQLGLLTPLGADVATASPYTLTAGSLTKAEVDFLTEVCKVVHAATLNGKPTSDWKECDKLGGGPAAR